MPSYYEMARAAIVALNGRDGSSNQVPHSCPPPPPPLAFPSTLRYLKGVRLRLVEAELRCAAREERGGVGERNNRLGCPTAGPVRGALIGCQPSLRHALTRGGEEWQKSFTVDSMVFPLAPLCPPCAPPMGTVPPGWAAGSMRVVSPARAHGVPSGRDQTAHNQPGATGSGRFTDLI